MAQAAGSPPGRAPRAAPTRQEVEDGHVDDVEEAAAAAVRVDLLHRVAVKRVDFPPEGRTGPGLQKPGRQGVRPASMPPAPVLPGPLAAGAPTRTWARTRGTGRRPG